MIRTEREKAQEKGKYNDIEFRRYTDDEIDAIDAQYAAQAESRRGAEPRFWEDVTVGDDVGPMVKGPLTVTDMVCWHVGMGMGLYGVRALDLAARNRRRIPRFFHRDEQNVPDVMQRVHWDPEFAAQVGESHHVRLRARCARPGSSTSAPTGWATTRGSGSSTASSGASTTWATRSGCGARSPRSSSPTAIALRCDLDAAGREPAR